MAVINATITTGGVAQDLIQPGVPRAYVEITAVDDDVWVRFAATAAVNTGDLVAAGQTRSWLFRYRPEITERVSVLSPTTGARVIMNYDTGA